jgi:hypothetical protein
MERSYERELRLFKKNGYVVFKKHMESATCVSLANLAVKNLFDLAFQGRPGEPEPSFENLKYFGFPEERKKLKHPLCIWVGGKSELPLCSRITGSCYGSYLKEVQTSFTMTRDTFERHKLLYGTDNIGQLYGPKKYCIRMKGGLQTNPSTDANLISDYNNVVTDEKIISFLVVSVDTNIKMAETGTWCVIPRFHLYRHYARIFFNFVGGLRKLPLDLSSPMKFPEGFLDENLPAFNQLLKEMYTIKAKKLKPRQDHLPYLKLTLPEDKFSELKWETIFVEPGDLVCRSQWLPHYEFACRSDTPFIAFQVGYYVIPDEFLGSYKQRRLVKALHAGHTMEEDREWDEARNNSCETAHRKRIGNHDTFFYMPEDEDELEFAFQIQCIDAELMSKELHMDSE